MESPAMRRRTVLLTIALVIALPLLLLWLRGYRLLFLTSSLFEGDGRIVDNGIWSTPPRYVITFPQISLPGSGNYEFRCRGVPWAALTFMLRAVDQTAQQALAKAGDAEVELRITDASGRVVCAVDKPLKEWILQNSPATTDLTSFWDYPTRDITFAPDIEYTFSIRLKNAAWVGPIWLEPQLLGGGIERL
jgi:hypothetical protein